MPGKENYILYCLESHFGRGTFWNTQYRNDGLFLSEASRQEDGWYFSPMMDGKIRGKLWKTAQMRGMWYPNTSVTIRFYASDSERPECCGGQTVSAILQDSALAPQEKEQILQSCDNCSFVNCSDMMLSPLKGRYLWFSVRLQGISEQSPWVSLLKIELESADWMQYLPEIYQSDSESADFTSRFLRIFQSLYDALGEKIFYLPAQYDIRKNSRDMMEWMAQWIGIPDTACWNDRRLRELLRCANDYQQRIGTAGMLSDITELYTGVRPILLENLYAADEETAVQAWRGKAYPREPFAFTVLLPNHAVRTEEQHRTLLQILADYKPAHMHFQLIFTDVPWGIESGHAHQDSGGIYLNARSTLTKRGKEQ